MESDVALSEKNKGIVKVHEDLLNWVEGNEELEIIRCRTCANVSRLQFKKVEREEDKRVVELLFLLPNLAPTVHTVFVQDSLDTLTLSWSEAGGQVLQDTLLYEPRRKNGGYVEVTAISIGGLDFCINNMLHYPVNMKKRG